MIKYFMGSVMVLGLAGCVYTAGEDIRACQSFCKHSNSKIKLMEIVNGGHCVCENNARILLDDLDSWNEK